MGKGIKKTNAARLLDEMDIRYELAHFEADEADLSAEAAALAVGMPYEQVYKTLVARGDKTGVLEVCLPAGAELDLKALAQASGNKSAALVHLKELQPLTGYVRGGCSPLGGKKEYPVYIHDDAANQERIAVNAGARGLLFIIAPDDLLKATGGKLARLVK
ncbi:MAG: Cys-tRNA(Pro) deacylase [Synergistaceae bacterium]|jgi:Cys-tRNA(Pro)/Cys-tRNA(Cys) deacylase|nr:Cys-tRNA(Pro) deacylase [Synergistaceae bacterium]